MHPAAGLLSALTLHRSKDHAAPQPTQITARYHNHNPPPSRRPHVVRYAAAY